MIPKILDQIEEADLEELSRESVREGTRLEYKLDIPNTPDGKRGLLKAVCSLANTLGGDLVIGVETDREDSGVPVGIAGIEVADVDSEILRLDSIVRHNLEPQLSTHFVRGISLQNGRTVFVIRVQQSWKRPHRVKNSRVFYARNSAGSYELDLPEIRRILLQSEGQADRIRDFVAERLIAIKAGDTPVPLIENGRISMHLVPFASLEPGSELMDSSALQEAQADTLSARGEWGRLTLDGYVRWWPGDSLSSEQSQYAAYVQLYRSGIIEAVDAFRLRQEREEGIPTLTVEQDLVRVTGQYLQILEQNDISTPVYVFLNLLNVRGRRLALPSNDHLVVYGVNVHPFDREDLAFPEVVVADYGSTATDLLRTTFDRLWNAVGIHQSPYSDAQRAP